VDRKRMKARMNKRTSIGSSQLTQKLANLAGHRSMEIRKMDLDHLTLEAGFLEG
jgi:hypothetical protein